jgi:hypothetical protein
MKNKNNIYILKKNNIYILKKDFKNWKKGSKIYPAYDGEDFLLMGIYIPTNAHDFTCFSKSDFKKIEPYLSKQ